MSINGNARKTEVLGMPPGTAAAQLRKLVLFELVKRNQEDVCFHCQKQIETVRELSIEHKKPWLDNVELFWALDNIAFSHLGCNSAAADRTWHRNQRRIPPDGMEWCSNCKDFRLLTDFTAAKPKRPPMRTVHSYCKQCRKDNPKWS